MNIDWAIFNSPLRKIKKSKMKTHEVGGFTLAELLISLAILGVIATFTIPKVLNAQKNGAYQATAKEAVAAISQAYQIVKLNGQFSASTTPNDIAQSLNYIRIEPNGTLYDDQQGFGSSNCGNNNCFVLANGSLIRAVGTVSFGGTDTTNAVFFHFDPVAGYSGTTTDGKLLQVWLYYNGRITTRDNLAPNTYTSSSGPHGPGNDPSWFSW